jgi:hypothetical protein
MKSSATDFGKHSPKDRLQKSAGGDFVGRRRATTCCGCLQRKKKDREGIRPTLGEILQWISRRPGFDESTCRVEAQSNVAYPGHPVLLENVIRLPTLLG